MSRSFLQGAGYVLTGLRWLPKAGGRGFVALPAAVAGATLMWNHRRPASP